MGGSACALCKYGSLQVKIGQHVGGARLVVLTIILIAASVTITELPLHKANVGFETEMIQWKGVESVHLVQPNRTSDKFFLVSILAELLITLLYIL